MKLLDHIKSIDIELLFLINNKLSNKLFDIIMPIITNEYYWILPIIFLISYLLFFNKIKGKIVLIIIFISLGINDYFCASILKPYFSRLRPSYEILEYINLLVPKGGKWSMPSNHASNMFALATIISYFYSNKKWSIYFLAIIISFSRVYVGVHYPLDVITGSLIGYTISWIIITFWVKIKLYELKNNRTWVWYEADKPKLKF